MKNFPLPRIDKDPILKKHLEQYCRLKFGEIWEDPEGKHKVACLDSGNNNSIYSLIKGEKLKLAIHDPPYNMIAFNKLNPNKFVDWCKNWIETTYNILEDNAALYVWLGADQKKHFEPFAEFILMMKETNFLKSVKILLLC